MIIANAPRVKQIIIEVWRPLLALAVWDVIVTVFYYVVPFRAPALPLTLFGSALALFLGFRDNSAYQRWWEGRVLWGAMINASRSLARAANAFIGDGAAQRGDVSNAVIRAQIAYVHALRCQLRRLDVRPQIERVIGTVEADRAMGFTNPANALLDANGRRIADAERSGLIDTIQQAQIERVLIDIANAQGGMERLKNTPLPMQYRFFPELFARLFCVVLPIGLVENLQWATPIGSTLAGLMFLAALRIADDLVDPFSSTVHDVPMTAMCRTIEIDLLQSIGHPAPELLKPERGILW